MVDGSPWWAPHVYADRRDFLKARGRIAAAGRRFFDDNGFAEVETACLQVSPGNEVHLAAFSTELTGPDGASSRLYLHTSPEFACKKLLAAGEPRIFTFARAFRNRERSALHHPEFTMLEWYRANEPYGSVMADCLALARAAATAAGAGVLTWRGRRADPFGAPEFVTVTEAFSAHAGLDLMAALDDRTAMAAACRRLGIRVAADDDWSDLFSKILSERVEPRLGAGRLTFLTEYPACEAALARLKADDPRVSERFELYACGVELANGFGELVDAAEQRRRFEAAMALKQARYGEAYPIDADFLRALEIMPQASGVALGFDRLVMLAAGAERIEQVLWTPVAERGAA
ncbi:MAG: EF-P lysine aminoacylase GenX [Hyphomicrobiales bacterium]|nr:EF-P lysine aminoacylase GenX [Hyphomicrobiales bacterium]